MPQTNLSREDTLSHSPTVRSNRPAHEIARPRSDRPLRSLTSLQRALRASGERDGTSPFGNWFAALAAITAAKITTAVRRLELGNFSNVKGVGFGVFEYRIDFGSKLGLIHSPSKARQRDQRPSRA